MPLGASAVIAGIGAAAKIGIGVGELLHSGKKGRKLKDPHFNIQKEYYDNQTLAQNLAQGGLTQEAKQYYTSQADRGLSAGIDATLQGGGNVNSVNTLLDTYQQGVNKIAAEDSQLKTKNIESLMERNSELAAQKVQQWAINEYEPAKDAKRAVAQERAAGFKNVVGGLGEASAVLSSYGQADNYDSLMGSGNRSTTPGASVTPMTPAANAGPVSTGNMFADYLSFANANNKPDVATNVDGNAAAPNSDELLTQIYDLLSKKKR